MAPLISYPGHDPAKHGQEKMPKKAERRFGWTDLWFVPSIPTNATFSPIGLPLPSEPSAVAFVVVVVRRSVKPIPIGRSIKIIHFWSIIWK